MEVLTVVEWQIRHMRKLDNGQKKPSELLANRPIAMLYVGNQPSLSWEPGGRQKLQDIIDIFHP